MPTPHTGLPSVTAAPREGAAARDAEFARVALVLLPNVARIARSITRNEADADDLVQDTYLRAYRHWDTFIAGSDCLRWLATICRNTWAGQRARLDWVTAVGDVMELDTFAAVQLHKRARDEGVENMFARLDLAPAIHDAIASLLPDFQAVVMLVDVEGFRYEEAAELLAIPVGTVRSRLYRARRELQGALVNFAADSGFARVRTTTIGSAVP